VENAASKKLTPPHAGDARRSRETANAAPRAVECPKPPVPGLVSAPGSGTHDVEDTGSALPAPIRLALAGSEAIVLACLEQLFSSEKDFEIVARCVKGENVLFAVGAFQPDVLLLELPPAAAAESLDLLKRIKAMKVPTRVVLLCERLRQAELQEAVRLGVRAVVSKDVAPKVLAHCIRNVHGGGVWFGTRPAPGGVDTAPGSDAATPDEARSLTAREIEVVRLVSVGMRNRQIAEKLAVAEGTVKTHLHHIYEKLTLRGRLELSLYGRNKWL
jgi:two-component system nitrate/nitrite response regulator NarL